MKNFRKSLEKDLLGKDISPQIEIDLEIEANDINWDLMSEIKRMEPFGEGNEEPVFLAKNMVD